jgi:antitoxin ParD1/3/4
MPELESGMPTRNVVLTEQQSQLVDELVREGRYQNASEVLREGLRLLADQQARRAAELDDIRSGVLRGLGQANAGDFAAGTGEEAVRRAFDQAVEQRSA